MTLNAETVQKLRQPFALEHIRWKIQTNPKDNQEHGVVVVFVDARTIAAHLDDVVPGQWSTEYHVPPVTVGLPALECRLTVCGVTRCDVGTVAPSKTPDADTKDLYSDAFKRAAVQYGIGAFLYRFPQVKAKVEKFGNSYYLTRESQAELKALTEAVLRGDASLPRFKSLKVSAYNPDGVNSVTGSADQPAAPPAADTLTAGQAQTLHKRMGAALQNTARREMTHTEYAARVLGRPITSLTDLTVEEARQVQASADQEPQTNAA